MAFGTLLGKRNKEINKVVLIPLNQIICNPYQPRQHFDQEALQELSKSIIANGLLQPVTVRKLEDEKYELIAGERRTLAFRAIGKEHIPAIVEEFSDQQSAVLALIENLQRKDLNYFEEANGIAKLMQQLHLSQQQISSRLGKAQSTVANKLRLLRYSSELQQEMLVAGLTERHARALLKLSDDKIQPAVQYIKDKELNVEETEEYVEQLLLKKELKTRTRLFVVKDMRMFQNSINKAISLMSLAGIAIDSQKKESEEYIEYHIKIPKNAVYKSKTSPQNQTKIDAV